MNHAWRRCDEGYGLFNGVDSGRLTVPMSRTLVVGGVAVAVGRAATETRAETLEMIVRASVATEKRMTARAGVEVCSTRRESQADARVKNLEGVHIVFFTMAGPFVRRVL